jgi:hypothetical protein
MTLAEMDAELERLQFWDHPTLRVPAGPARLDLLDSFLSGDAQNWVQMGQQFKHAARLTEEDRALVRDWCDERRAALNEDLARILLGEGRSEEIGEADGDADLKEIFRQARPLVEELAQLARQMEWQTELEPRPERAGEVSPQALRFRTLAVTLSDLIQRRAG